MNSSKKAESKLAPFGMLLQFSKGLRGTFAWSIVITAVSILLSYLNPQVIRIIVDSVIGQEPFNLPNAVVGWLNTWGGREWLRANLLFCAAFVLIFAVLSGITSYYGRVGMAKFSEGMILNLRNRLYAHIQHLPYRWHVSNQTGDTIQRCTSDVDVVRNFVSGQLMEMFRTIFLLAVSLSLMFAMNVKLSLIALAFIPVVMLYSGGFFSVIRKRFQEADEAEGDLSAMVQENFTGVRVVRAFGRQSYEIDRFDEKNNKFANMWIRLGYVLGTYWGVGDLVSGLQVMVIIVVGVLEAVSGSITLGEFLVFVIYNNMLVWPIRSFGRILSELSKTSVSLKRIHEILNEQEEEDSPEDVTPPMNGDIRFHHVTFDYAGIKPVLRDLDFTIKAGTTFGILGSTGSGKSTLVALLDRLYDLPEGCGEITVGGVDIRRMKRDWVRSNIGVVLQEPFLYSKTIKENIGVTLEQTDLREIRHSAQAAAVDDSIMGFSEGYDTVVGERGVTLSGGQKQRVAIARMLIQDTPIKVFDDSFSAVDAQTDAQIRQSLRQNTANSTVILISHRITTLMQADQILVLDDGKVVEMGTHHELMEQNGIYRRIADIQGSMESELEEVE